MKNIIILLLLITATSCSSNIGTSVANPPTSTAEKEAGYASKALNSVFSAFTSGSNLVHRVTCGPNDPGCTCQDIINGVTNPNFTSQEFGTPDTYGSADTSITIADDDFCKDSEGNIQTLSLGPDDNGLFAGFLFEADISLTCTEGDDVSTVIIKADSAGVFRNTVDELEELFYVPQLYGNFIIENSDGDQEVIDCTVFRLEDGTIDFSECTDADGVLVEQTTDVVCE